ncbi:MAG TPA: tetratricopeptide repeat protein [Kofleriaceae bacterium]|nr:tetratricopeptide repeat protein [Kofleriaceae bacterium]
MHRLDTMRYSVAKAALAACAALLAALLGAGCDELSSRQEIQKANKLYAEGRYAKAVELYKSALDRTPTLTIGQHNAGLAYYKLFQPGVETKENRAIAEQSAAHFMKYLETNPNDRKVITLVTTIWLDSGQFDKALNYWSQVLAKDPQNRGVLEKLANINRQAGRFEEARKLHLQRSDLETDRGAKVKALLDIGYMEWSRLTKPDLIDVDRLAVADIGIAALQKAETLDPKHDAVQSLMASLYLLRSLAHGAFWAKCVDVASEKYHHSRFSEIKKGQAAGAGVTPAKPGQPGAPGQPAPAGAAPAAAGAAAPAPGAAAPAAGAAAPAPGAEAPAAGAAPAPTTPPPASK